MDWTSVNHKKPEKNQDVMGFLVTPDGKIVMPLKWKYGKFMYFSKKDVEITEKITHWMPFPEEPKEKT